MKFATAVLFFIFLSHQLMAQDTVVYGLDSVAVSYNKFASNKQLISQVLFQSNPNQTFAELLQKQSGMFIRSQGNATLSTPSYKGLGSMHIPIYLQGINMQSSMNGTMDLSLIDAVHFNSIQFTSQDMNKLGIQSMGEGISLQSDFPQTGININASLSSLHEYGVSGAYAFQYKNLKYCLSVSTIKSENKINLKHYQLDSFLQNTEFHRASVMQNINYAWTNNSITSQFYFLTANRGIPPSIGENQLSRQEDNNGFLLTEYQKTFSNRSILKISNQLSKEKIGFQATPTSKNSISNVINLNTNLSFNKRFNKNWSYHFLWSNLQANYTSDALRQSVNWNRNKASFTIKKQFKKGYLNYTHGAIHTEQQWATRISLDINYRVHSKYMVKANLQKVYRLPVLNELFWYQPGEAMGNIDLKPEEGYKVDFILARSHNQFQWTLNPHGGIFKNWVQWGGFPEIKPYNLNQVQIVGLVGSASYTYPFQKYKLLAQTNAHYVRSVYVYNNKTDPRHHQQLIFTPQFSSNLTLSFVFRRSGVYMNLQQVGKNYVTSDNSIFIDPYVLIDVGGYYSNKTLRISATLTNVRNTPYYTQPRTPLPGRTLKITLTYKIYST